ncbi:MAG: YdcH family protein [Pseudomonadota bacterium]
MFSDRQEDVENLLTQNIEFRRLYNKHQELDKRVHDAEIGLSPMEDLALNQLKKEKLWAKDQMARLLDSQH